MKTRRSIHRPRSKYGQSRGGFSVLIVLLLIAVTLSMCYASVRTQSVNARIQRNAVFRVSARAAAVSGLTTALQVMHTNAWEGVDTTLAGQLNDYNRFEVTFTTGDASLEAGDDDYDRYPYRVTLASTGYAADPANPTRIAMHRAEAVVELIPRALSAPVSGLAELTERTLCQWDNGTCSLCVPFRVEGPVRLRSQVELDENLNWTSDQQWWYYLGLNEMRAATATDWRPFTGPVYFRFDEQHAQVYALINTALQAQTVYTTAASTFAWQSNDDTATYRLFPGGKLYDIEAVASTVNNTELGPNPETNPTGLFVRSGSVQIRAGATIRGTLFTRGDSASDIVIQGDDITLEPVDLLPVEGVADPIQLPTLVSADDITFGTNTTAIIKGLVLARDSFEVASTPQNQMELRIEGHVACKDIKIGHRKPWHRPEVWWNLAWIEFWNQKSDGIQWFPALLHYLPSVWGLDIEPHITITPDTRSIQYHYYDLSQPVFAPHADDDGLRWNVVRWTMNP